MTPALAEVVANFGSVHPECVHPHVVHDRCHLYAEKFSDWVSRALPEADIEVISGVKMEDGLITCGHFVTRVDDMTIDWTARQFYPDASVPRLMPLAAWRAEWPNLIDALEAAP